MVSSGVHSTRGRTTSSSWRTSGTEATMPFFPPALLHRLQECEGEHGQRDVVVPASVLGDLIVVQAQLTLGQLEVLLDRPAQQAHPGHLRQCDRAGLRA